MHEVNQARDSGRAIERLSYPGTTEVTPLREIPGRAAQPLDGPVIVGITRTECTAATTERASHAF